MLIHQPFLHKNPLFSSTKDSENVLLRLKKKSRRNININNNNNNSNNGSEFETDKDKAREALRKLDEQLLSLSTKPVTPKIRAVELRQPSLEEEELLEVSGSFWASAISFLFLFTILYNILFVTIIKPSIDGPEPVESREIDIKLDDKEVSPY